MDLIDGVIITELKVIPQPKGNILHALKKSDAGFTGFGEAYFSIVHKPEIKGWKRHSRMMLNLIVPSGDIRFVLFDQRPESPTYNTFNQIDLGATEYARLTVPPMIWMAFQGIGPGSNMLLNIASIEHDPSEAESCDISEIDFTWHSV